MFWKLVIEFSFKMYLSLKCCIFLKYSLYHNNVNAHNEVCHENVFILLNNVLRINTAEKFCNFFISISN